MARSRRSRPSPRPGPRRAAGGLAVLFEGAPSSVAERARRLLRRLGDEAHQSSQPPAWWGRYPFCAGEVVVRQNSPGGELRPVCYALADAIGFLVPVRGSLSSGQAWTALPADLPVEHAIILPL